MPTVLRGFSDAYGSWKIICMSRRSSRSSPPLQLGDVVAVELDRALGGSYSRITTRARVDLPQPVSPTSPTVSPG